MGSSQSTNNQQSPCDNGSAKGKAGLKILLLGASDTGKSTVLKQMKLIYEGGYMQEEREGYKEIIFTNAVSSMRATLEAMVDLGLQVAPQNSRRKDVILSAPLHVESLSLTVIGAIENLWRDAAVRNAVQQSSEFQLGDSAAYFFENINRLGSYSYLPTDQDILRSMFRTTGVTEATFSAGQLTYNIYDFGGLRLQRKKWIHRFENADVVIFLVSLSEYDQVLQERADVNRIQESLTLFDSICNSRWFTNTSIILFLNKFDVFEEKLPRSRLEDYFPGYTGGNNVDAACDYILQRFLSLNQTTTKRIHAHFTVATDTQQMKFVLNSVQDILLLIHFRECNQL
ncbi:hypothetical protein NP233_g1371 [Leucocoprinus birnbaumii]|uniref:Uncharacterized protein n=1 Tax=Leucocoprinus birnbaumii TaxID=56174 RepID=A0AAD5YY07_9AGAR|nr:hypothetical protein NP233_g1371 [Leucocoprinus birnbaumii]